MWWLDRLKAWRFRTKQRRRLLKALGNADDKVFCKAASSISSSWRGTELGHAAIEPLLRALSGRRWEAKEAALQALGSLGDARAALPLLENMEASIGSQDKVFQACLRLADVSTAPFVAVLDDKRYKFSSARVLEGLKKQRATRVAKDLVNRLMAVDSLRDHPPTLEDLEAVMAALKDRDHHVRSDAAKVLGRVGDPCSVDALMHHLQEYEGDVRSSVVGALRAIGDPRTLAVLVKGLDDPDPLNAMLAAKNLAELGDRGAVKPLSSIVALDNEQLRSRWQEAIAGLPRRSELQYAAETAGCAAPFPHDFIDVRIAAAEALALLGAPAELDVIVGALVKVIPSTSYGLETVEKATREYHAERSGTSEV